VVGRVLVVAVLVALAGCAGVSGPGTPTDTGQDVVVTLSNEHTERYRVSVTAVPPAVEGLTVTYENGTTRTFAVTSVEALPRGGLDDATAIATTGGEERSRAFTLGPGEGFGTRIEGVSADATVVYFVTPTAGQQRVRGVGSVRCPGATTTDLTVAVSADGSVRTAVVCSDGTG
jgi:hypothetical protein